MLAPAAYMRNEKTGYGVYSYSDCFPCLFLRLCCAEACADPCPECIFYSLRIFRELVLPYIPYVDTALDIYTIQEVSHLRSLRLEWIKIAMKAAPRIGSCNCMLPRWILMNPNDSDVQLL